MTTGLRETVLQIVNRVERKLRVPTSAALTSTKLSRELLDLLNEVLDEISDAGDWQEYKRETEVTAAASTATYEVAVSGLVKNVREIVFGSAAAPLVWRDMEDIRLLNRVSSYGQPRQVCIEGVNASSGNPIFRVTPVPTQAVVSGNPTKAFNVLYFQKPPLYGTGDGSVTVVFPSNLVVAGVYAKALLAESGGAPTNEYQTAYAEYIRMRREVNNRFNADVNAATFFKPRH